MSKSELILIVKHVYETSKLMSEEAVEEKRTLTDPVEIAYWQGRADAARAIWIGCLRGGAIIGQLRDEDDE